MSIVTRLPHQARFVQTSNIFTAEFNKVNGVVTGTGKYDFGQLINADVLVLPTQIRSLYFIERINVGGSISEGDYLEAINIIPLCSLKRLKKSEIIYKRPIPIVNFIDNQEANAWFVSDKDGDAIRMTVTGLLDQTAALVGEQYVKLQISLNIYIVESARYVAAFMDALGDRAGVDLLNP